MTQKLTLVKMIRKPDKEKENSRDNRHNHLKINQFQPLNVFENSWIVLSSLNTIRIHLERAS